MKKFLLFLIIAIFAITPAFADNPLYKEPVKRLAAMEIFDLLSGVPYGTNINDTLKHIGPPVSKNNDNWSWQHINNGTILRMYFNNTGIIYRGVIQEMAFSPEDSKGRTEILAGQYERRFGPPIKDEANADSFHIRLWDVSNTVLFSILTNYKENDISYIMEPKAKK